MSSFGMRFSASLGALSLGRSTTRTETISGHAHETIDADAHLGSAAYGMWSLVKIVASGGGGRSALAAGVVRALG